MLYNSHWKYLKFYLKSNRHTVLQNTLQPLIKNVAVDIYSKEIARKIWLTFSQFQNLKYLRLYTTFSNFPLFHISLCIVLNVFLKVESGL